MTITSLRIITIGLLLGLATTNAAAQFYFGQNKVQYTDFDWQVMETNHFRIYFDRQAADIAGIAARSAEDAYDSLSAKFNHELTGRVPMIIYSSPSFFSQTNTINQLVPESVAGFTEFLKGRVVLPFNGSYRDFDHVITHEVVHVFQIDRLQKALARQGNIRYGWPPLWFTEGLAEYWSKDWDTEADMFVKDMVLNDRLPAIDELWAFRGTYFMYKLGESICTFIDTTYGSDVLTRIYQNWSKDRSFDEVVRLTTNVSLDEISRQWQYSLKKRYFPQIDTLGLPQLESRQLTRDGFTPVGVPLRWADPSTGDTTEWLVFKANRVGYTGLYRMPLGGGEVETLVRGERSSDFESLHLLRSSIDANDNGEIVFSAKSKERDLLNVYSLAEMDVVDRYEIPHLTAARSPRLSPDGRYIVFTGHERSGYSNLYLLDRTTGGSFALLDDRWHDVDPAFTPEGSAVIFVSDRGRHGASGATNLFRYDLESKRIAQLTFGPFEDRSPEPTDYGIFFSSNRTGSYNVLLRHDDGTLTQQSTMVTGAFSPRLTPDGKSLTYTGYSNLRYQLYQLRLPDDPADVTDFPATTVAAWHPERIDSSYTRSSIRYDTEFSFDIAQSQIGYDPISGTVGGFQAALSDMLGNQIIYFLLTNTAEDRDEFLSSFNVAITYLDRGRRLNYGFGAYHIYDEYFNDRDQFYDERQAGGLGILSYPVSRFTRFDFATFARYLKRDRRFGQTDREAFVVTNSISWIVDNSLWDISGPIEGRRYNITAALSTAADKGRIWSRTFSVDLRHYFRIGRYSAFANRLYGYTSDGIEPQRRYFGGSWSFRGFDRREWYVPHILFASNELRFPLVDNLLIGLPIGALGFQAIRGALFFDVGSAWEDDFDQFLGSFGAGIRVTLGYYAVLRFDFSRTTDFETVSDGTDVDFFFGWNF